MHRFCQGQVGGTTEEAIVQPGRIVEVVDRCQSEDIGTKHSIEISGCINARGL